MATNELFLERPSESQPLSAKGAAPVDALISDPDALKLFKEYKKQAFDSRWIWERQWMRNIHYVNKRQWIEYVRRTNEWRDVRLANWFPKPVSDQLGPGVQALRAMFAGVNIGVNVRPVGGDPERVAVAAISDDLHPLLHEVHEMDEVLDEADYWFIVTGNVFTHTYLERDAKHGMQAVPLEQCTTCTNQYTAQEIMDAGNTCPECGQTQFEPATDDNGEPATRKMPGQKGVTVALSPFELAFDNSYARFKDVPYVIRLRWRAKSYYEYNPELWAQVKNIKWAKAPAEQALQLFRSLPYQNDLGVAPFLGTSGTGEGNSEEGTTEYEIWVRPCDRFPQGLVMRIVNDANPIVLHLEQDEAIPGPLPYVDAEGKAVFTFSHAAFEQRGGRVYGTSPLDGVIQKQNMLNQLDSFMLMIVNRMSNPLWLVPKGSEIEKFTGQPGMVVKWNPLTVGGTAKPERIDGVAPGVGLFTLREQYVRDIEEGLGSFDILKGQKPAGVDAFSALQLLVERSQSRFASAFKARGRLYADWYKFALEIEREFGPDVRTKAVRNPAGGWAIQRFKRADLANCFEVIVEDGSMTPKTQLGMRAAIEHLRQLGFIDPADPDQKYKVYQTFGQTQLSPKLDVDMQSALRKQYNFEQWSQDKIAQLKSGMKMQEEIGKYQQAVAAVQPTPAQIDPATGQDMAPPPQLPPPPSINKFTPLAWKPWYNAPIHKQEFLKWANSDRMVELLEKNPALESLLTAHLQEMDASIQQAAMQQAMMQAGPQKPGKAGKAPGGIGAGRAMANSNSESGGSQNSDGGHAAPPPR
jgi:hypothetical protein